MKVRNGFVTNSSSSSYVCEICNQADVSYEGLDEIGMCECPAGHIFCQEHVIDVPDEDVHLSYITEILDRSIDDTMNRYKEQRELATSLLEMSIQEREQWIIEHDTEWTELRETFDLYEGSAYISEIECPICTGDHVSEYEMIKYIEEHFNITKAEIREAIRKMKREEREML